MTVDIVIPTYKPDERLIQSINMLRRQSIKARRIILMNTEQKYLENFMRGRNYDSFGKFVEVKHISAWEFDHGTSRNMGAKGSDADYLLFMTQDAVPSDEYLIEKMLRAFDIEGVASCYARQLPYEDASLAEQFSRKFNYPEESSIKSIEDLPRLGIKTYFCSNACAMYKREVFDRLGGFPEKMIFNEDMVYAHKVIHSGYSISYVADAAVYHSHNYTNMQQFHRNFDLAVSQAMHPEVFDNISSEAEGASYAKSALSFFISNKKPFLFIPFALSCAFRLLGYKMGKKYDKLSHSIVLKCTMSPRFFKNYWS